MVTYPNQKIVTIHKDKYYQDFLQVGKDEWMYAYSILNRGAFGLYLYLCGNMNGYRFALSSVAVQNALDVSDSTYRRTYRRAVESLLEAGYLIMDGKKHVLHFYAKPRPTTYISEKKKGGAAAPMDEPSLQPDEDNWGDEALSYIVY